MNDEQKLKSFNTRFEQMHNDIYAELRIPRAELDIFHKCKVMCTSFMLEAVKWRLNPIGKMHLVVQISAYGTKEVKVVPAYELQTSELIELFEIIHFKFPNNG